MPLDTAARRDRPRVAGGAPQRQRRSSSARAAASTPKTSTSSFRPRTRTSGTCSPRDCWPATWRRGSWSFVRADGALVASRFSTRTADAERFTHRAAAEGIMSKPSGPRTWPSPREGYPRLCAGRGQAPLPPRRGGVGHPRRGDHGAHARPRQSSAPGATRRGLGALPGRHPAWRSTSWVPPGRWTSG